MFQNFRYARRFLFFICIAICIYPLTTASAAKSPAKTEPPATPAVPFVWEKPADWVLSQAGTCDTLTLFLRNPAEPLQQLFFFPRFGPVYMTQEQKSSDLQYEVLSGQNLNRLDMPVIQPLTPENFIRFLPQVLQMQSMRNFLPERPNLRVIEPIAAYPQKKALEYPDTQTAIIRILFVQDNRLGEGLIAITTVPSPEFRNAPGGGIGMGYLLYGLTAPKGGLSSALPAMLAVGRSFKLGPEYEKKCNKERAEDEPTLLQAGQSLRPIMDAMALSWEKRQPAEDLLTEKKADAFRSVERLYSPTTGTVYEFPVGFSADYLPHPDRYNLTDLRPLPEELSLWLKIPLDGSKAVTKN